ncbi:hypothetical protein Clacol_002227 [Clathrus columnatus]|uniref:DUF2415 domain-containing protein n=1 Tax=Clathrus columnatus TaxID=1419009 RepID=A0AAV5A7Z2_9AGAM|nr:hypothetical protein Clacol_002227 [Clathrus columnatus]
MTRTLHNSRPSDLAENNSPKRSLLLSNHTAAALARPTIAHSQLRYLITCPQRRGIVYYVSDKSIVERDLLHPYLPPRNVIDLEFLPTCFAASTIASNPQAILFAAGGQHSQLHLSLHSFTPVTSPHPPTYTPPKLLWKHDGTNCEESQEIVNTIMFSPTSLTDEPRRPGSSDLRMVVGGNNKAVRFYDLILQPNTKDSQRMQLCGQVMIETCVNHVSISPNGRTLLCVGDTPKIYLYHISPGSNVTFLPIAIYDLPRPPSHLLSFPPSPTTPPSSFSSIACFSSAWSPDGFKFVVGSQEGQLCVWDVRSASPIFEYWTPYRVNHKWKEWQWEGVSSGWGVSSLDENGPDSGIRSVKFTGGESDRELLVWVEQTSNMHVIDARTFDLATHSIIPFPDLSDLLPPSLDPTLMPSSTPIESPPALPEVSQNTSTETIAESISRTVTTETAAPLPAPPTGDAGSEHPRPRTFSFSSLPPLATLSSSTSASSSSNSETDSRQQRRSPSLTTTNSSSLLRSLRTIEESQRRRDRFQRQRAIQEQLQREAQQLLNESGAAEARSRTVPLRNARDDGLRQALVQSGDMPSGTMLQILQAILSSDGQTESTEIRNLLEETHTRLTDAVRSGAGRPHRSEIGTEHNDGADDNDDNNDEGPVQISGLCLDPTGGWIYVAGTTGLVEWRVREREEGKGGALGGWV